jgi:hypothetical protein
VAVIRPPALPGLAIVIRVAILQGQPIKVIRVASSVPSVLQPATPRLQL